MASSFNTAPRSLPSIGLWGALFLLLPGGQPASGSTLHRSSEKSFDAYIRQFGRTYLPGSEEYAHRRALFEERRSEVSSLNARPHRLWQAALSAFSDRTDAERASVLGWRRSDSATHGGSPHSSSSSGSGVSLLDLDLDHLAHSSSHRKTPSRVDWRFLKSADMVLDQGGCGSCWAATTASVLEAHYEIYNGGHQKHISVQEILSCTPNPRQCGGTGGCEGATVELGMDWVFRNGVSADSEMPYAAEDSECSRSVDPEASQEELTSASPQEKALAGLRGWHTLLPKNTEQPLVRAVVEWGPVAVSVGAKTWHEYSEGIFDNCDKDIIINHAVTLYGYGEDDGNRYWLIRNTWGPTWGESGFIRLLRHGDGETYCGWDSDYQQGVGCKNDPTSVQVCGMCGLYSDSVVPRFHGGKNGSKSVADFFRDAWRDRPKHPRPGDPTDYPSKTVSTEESETDALLETHIAGVAIGANAVPTLVRRDRIS